MSLFRHLIVIAFYVLIAFIALHNLIFHMTTHVPGTQPVDFYHFHWSQWWIRHALTNGISIYETNYIMAPFVSNLSFHVLAAFWFPLWALLEPLFGTLVAMTVVMLVAFTLTGYSMFLLLKREGAAWGLALVGGVMFQLMPSMYIATSYSNMNLLGWFWLPTLLLLWGRIALPVERGLTAKAPSTPRLGWFRHGKWILCLALALWGMVMTDLQYPLFASVLLVPYGVYTLWHAGTWAQRVGLALYGALAVTGALLLLWFVGPLPYMLRFSNEGLAFTPVDQALSLDFPLGYLYQTVDSTRIGYLALPLLFLASLAFWRFKARSLHGTVPIWLWLALIPLPLLLAVGTATPLYPALHQMLGGMFRYPERFLPVFLIPSLLFAMLRLTPLARRAPIPVAIILLWLVLGWSSVYHPIALQTAPSPYAFYEDLGREPYDYVIIDVPTAGASGQGIVGEAQFITTQFYGITHGKRMTNGFIARVNTWQYVYMNTSDPMMSWLGQRRLLEPDAVEAQLRERIFSYPIGYFVIHRRFIDPGRFPTVVDEIVSYFNALPDLLCPYTIERDVIVYRTTWHPDGCPTRTPSEIEAGVYQVDIGAPQDVFHIGAGWHWQEDVAGLSARWMGAAPQTTLYVDLPPASYQVTFTAQAYLEARMVQMWVNGVPVGDLLMVMPDRLREYGVEVPAEVIGDGEYVTLTFAYDEVRLPEGGDTRALALLVDWVRFAAR